MTDEKEKTTDKQEQPKAVEESPILSQHSLKLGRKTLKYSATVGRMLLKNDKSEIEAQIFYTAYELDDVKDKSKRPLIFVFNGGPGSASIWLHLGAVGPKRAVMQADGWLPEPPYRLEDNPHTWLEFADLVFVDPVGTGFSRAVDSEKAKEKYWNVKGDLESLGEFIRLYLNKSKRWQSPLFLAGESYGTFRSAGLSKHLLDKGIGLAGIIFLSTVLNFQTLNFTRGNDLPYHVYLPTYAATAWYHKKTAPDLLAKALTEVLAEVEAFAETDYVLALAKGDKLSNEERSSLAAQLARYTGLSASYIEQTNFRIDIMRFCKELLREQNRTVGRLDSRFTGFDALPLGDRFEFDPSMTAIIPPYHTVMNQYLSQDLNYTSELTYEVLNFKVNQAWEYERGQIPDSSEDLRAALARNPYMKVLVAQGYYDLATPHFAWDYTYHHMDLEPTVRGNFKTCFYEAGHMMYLHTGELAKLKHDVSDFFATFA